MPPSYPRVVCIRSTSFAHGTDSTNRLGPTHSWATINPAPPAGAAPGMPTDPGAIGHRVRTSRLQAPGPGRGMPGPGAHPARSPSVPGPHAGAFSGACAPHPDAPDDACARTAPHHAPSPPVQPPPAPAPRSSRTGNLAAFAHRARISACPHPSLAARPARPGRTDFLTDFRSNRRPPVPLLLPPFHDQTRRVNAVPAVRAAVSALGAVHHGLTALVAPGPDPASHGCLPVQGAGASGRPRAGGGRAPSRSTGQRLRSCCSRRCGCCKSPVRRSSGSSCHYLRVVLTRPG